MIYPICTLAPSSTDTTDRFANPFHPRAWGGTDLGSRIPHPCTIRKLKIQRVAGPGAGITATYTMRRNNADTALACAISGTGLTSSDTANAVSYVDGDQISIKFRATGPGLGTPAASVVHISFDVETAEGNTSINCLMLPTPTATGVPVYTPAYGWPNGSLWFGGPLTDIHQGSSLIGPPGALVYVRVWLASGAVGAGDTLTILVYKNEVRQDGTGGTVDTRVTLSGASQIDATGTFNLTFTTGDRWAFACEGTGTPVLGNTGVSWVYEADTDGAFFIGSSPPATGLTTADRFNAPHETSAAGWTGTESAHTIKAGLSGLGLSGFTALTNAADDGRVVALRKNSADTAATATMAASSRTVQGEALVFYPDGSTFCIRTARATSTAINQMKYVLWGGPAIEEPPPGGEPEGGGEVENGPQPDPGVVPTTFPLLFAVFKDVAGDHAFVFGETQLNDDFNWYGGKKPGKIANVSPITRRLSREGAFEGVRCTLTIADPDRTFRDFLETTPARGISVELFLIDDALRRTASGPLTPVAFRIFCGRITGHRADPDWGYSFEVLDVLTQRLAEFNKQPVIPPDVLSSDVFGTLDPALQGKAAPIVIGRVTDVDGPVLSSVGPQGAVPLLSLGGPFNLSLLGGSWPSVEVDVFLLTKGAIPDFAVFDGYYNEPDTPGVRLEIPESAYGVVIWVPTKPGWAGADNFIDYMGERYTPVFIDRSVTLGGLTVADAIREGRMLVAFNMVGVVETISGGSDRYIDYPPRIWQWLLQNYCFTRYMTGDYADMPLLEGSYGVIDWESVEATVDTQTARLGGGSNRYVSGFILGGDGRQRALFDVLGELCQGADMDQGINRHGQLMLSADDFNEQPDPLHIFNATLHIEDENFEQWIDDAVFINRVEHQYSAVYLPPSAPNPVPAEGQPAPQRTPDYPEFQSGVVTTEDTTSQTQVNEIKTLQLKNYVIREEKTADDIELHILSRGVGPGKDGPRGFRMTGGYRLLGSGSTVVELGTVIGYNHPQKIGDAGMMDTARVTTITVDPIRKRVTLEGYFLNAIVGP